MGESRAVSAESEAWLLHSSPLYSAASTTNSRIGLLCTPRTPRPHNSSRGDSILQHGGLFAVHDCVVTSPLANHYLAAIFVTDHSAFVTH